MKSYLEETTTTWRLGAIYSRSGVDERGVPYIELYEDPETRKKLDRRTESAKRGWETRRAKHALTVK